MSNNLIFNLTIKIEKAVEQAWLADVKQNYLPLIVDGINILSAQINKLVLETPEAENTFAIQFIYPSAELFKEKKLLTMQVFLTAMDAKYRGKYVYFATMMELVHYYSKKIDNPQISLN